MKPFASASLALCLTLAWLPALAGEFLEVAETENGTTLSIDIDSYRVRTGFPSAWMLISSTRPEGKKLSAKVLYMADCSDESIAKKSYIDYAGKNGSGEVVGSYTFPDELLTMTPVAPGTLGEIKLKVLCHMQSNGSATGFNGMLDAQLEVAEITATNVRLYESVSPEQRDSMCKEHREFYAMPIEHPYDRFVAEAIGSLLNRFCGGVPKPKPPAAKAKPKGK